MMSAGAALQHAERGRPVFPCNGKYPLTEHGFRDATTDSSVIEAWWSRWPDANVAIRTGVASDLVVLDVDGDDGAESLRRLEREHGELPRTASVKTPSGGSHFYFRHPGDEIRSSVRKLAPALDVRAEGGYVIAPPSPGYESDEEAPIAEAPEWLVGLMREASRNGAAAPKVGPAIPKGKRNDTLARLAGTMRRPGMEVPAIVAALKIENANRCKPPLPEAEVERIAASIGRYPPADPAPAPVVESRRLADVLEAFDRRLYLPDLGIVTVTLGAVAANLLNGDPVWLVIVGPPSSGKTEVLMACTVLPNVHQTSTLTAAALLSGTPKKERAKDARGGLLPTIGEFGLIVCKDLTSILSMRRDAQAEALGGLREVYDGEYTRHVGTDGGRKLSWSGKVGLLAGCTETIDRAHAVMAAMGERFTLYRHAGLDAKDQARGALDGAASETEMREELREVVGGLFRDGRDGLYEPLPLSEADRERLVSLSAFAVRCRSAVERDGYSREIELVPHAELPARLVKVLARTIAGLDAIGVPRADAWPLVTKMGLDSIPALRLAVIEVLADTGEELAASAIGVKVGHPTQTTRRALEDLEAHGVLNRDTAGKTHRWRLSEWCREEYQEVRP
jgi:hypothetical protein